VLNLNALLVPTTGLTPRLAQFAGHPTQYDTNLGYYTNYVNLLDLCGIAVPNGFLPSGVPNGVTFVAPAWHDNLAYYLGRQFQKARNLTMGATKFPLPARSLADSFNVELLEGDYVSVAIPGSISRGLSTQLADLEARSVGNSRTAPVYRLFDVSPGGKRSTQSGFLRVASGGVSVDVQVWRMRSKSFAKLVLDSPLPAGVVELDNGRAAFGFLAEKVDAEKGKDVSK